VKTVQTKNYIFCPIAKKVTLSLILLTVLSGLISSCSTQAKKDLPIDSGINHTLLWPAAPAKPRIEFKQIVRTAKDLGITRSFFTKMVDWVFGESSIQFVKPMASVTLNDGKLFVADPGAHGIHYIDTSKNTYSLLNIENKSTFATPVGLATDGQRVFISDSTLGVFVFEKDAKFAVPLQLENPPTRSTGIAYNKKLQLLYIVDTIEHRINVYNQAGKFSHHIGQRGLDDGQFNFPTMLSIAADGKLFVTDSLNFRVQIFSQDGKFISTFGEMGQGTGGHSRPKGIATDKFGHIYVVDSLFHSVQIFNQQGEFLLNFGAHGSEFGEFWLPTGIFIDSENNTTIYVADSYNKRLQIFQYVGGAS